MTLLDRHIFKSVLFTCTAAVALFGFVLTVGNFIRDLLGPVLSGQLAPATMARLVLLLVPFVISYALPLGVLTGVLLTLGRLSSDSEITAMRAAGLSIPRIAMPVFILGILGAALGLRINFESMPWARIQYHKEFADALRANPLSFIVPKTFIREFGGQPSNSFPYVLYVGDKQGSVVRDFWLWQLDRERRVVKFTQAESGRVDYDEAANELVITLSNFHVETRNAKDPEDFTEAPYVASIGQSDPVRLSLAKMYGTAGVKRKTQWMTYSELRAEQLRLAAEPVPPGGAREHAQAEMKLALIMQDKFTLALAVFSFAFIGVPLGIRVSRRETSANLGIAVVLALGYYFLTVMVGWLDRHPEYRPDILLWVPNAIFLGLGVWLLWRMDRR
jgi:lipopolysaccharide export system permease protein